MHVNPTRDPTSIDGKSPMAVVHLYVNHIAGNKCSNLAVHPNGTQAQVERRQANLPSTWA